MTEYRRHPDLPEDFVWKPRAQYQLPDTALVLHDVVLVQMIDKINGGWFATLHLEDGIEKRPVTRHCTDFNTGRHGAELWVLRHEVALRAKAERKLAWIERNVVLNPPGGRRLDMSVIDRRIERVSQAMSIVS